LVLPAFDIYGKPIGDDNGDKGITTLVYEIRSNPKNAITLKKILSKLQRKNTIRNIIV